MKEKNTTPKKKASNTGYGKSGTKAMLKNAAKDLIKKAEENKKKRAEIKEKIETSLSPAEERFCQLYVSDVEFYGNGTQSYIEAFEVEIIKGNPRKDSKRNQKTIEAVREAAKTLLMNTYILNRIDELLEEGGFNDQQADKTLQFLMTQRSDLRVALGAAEAYNKLKARIQEKQHVLHSFATEEMTDAELMERIKKKQAFFNKE